MLFTISTGPGAGKSPHVRSPGDPEGGEHGCSRGLLPPRFKGQGIIEMNQEGGFANTLHLGVAGAEKRSMGATSD